MEVDQRIIMIIGGIQIFLPRNQVEASAKSLGATEGQPNLTFIKEENE
jgi:hypothetical protein